MDKIARVRQEIERLRQVYYNKESEWESRSDDRHGYAIWYEGKVHMCDEILSFLDTLSEEPDKSLEEEIRRYKEHYIKVKECGFSFDLMDIESTARHFAEWGAEHLRDSTKMIDKSMEEAARIYQEGVTADTTIYYCGASEDVYFANRIVESFKAGAEWQTEHLKK